MRKIKVEPNKIIVPGEYELGNESILKIYFRVFDKGEGNCLPPVIVTRIKDFSELESWLEDQENGFKKWETPRLSILLNEGTLEVRRRDYKELFKILEKSPYMVIDGNHKSAAATLTNKPISALELETDKDIEELKRMVEIGELFDFKRSEVSLYKLNRAFIAHCLDLNVRDNDGNISFPNSNKSCLKYTKTVKERVDELVNTEALPKYMIDRYLQRNY